MAKSIYIAQTAQGSDTGADAANAHAASWFNAAGNWGAGGTQVNPGDTVVLTGTISSPLQVKAGGTSGNKTTILFATNAKLSAPHWNQSTTNYDAALFINGYSYLVIDGGSNGLIEATANGSALANTVFNNGVIFESGSHDCEVKNLSILSLFVRVSGSASTLEDNSSGVKFNDSLGNNLIHDCIVRDICHGLHMNHSGTISGDKIYNNIIERRDAGIIYGSSGNGISTAPEFYNNQIGDAVQWEDSADNFHHDSIHLYWGAAAGQTGHPDGFKIYNNYFYGDCGIHSTGHIFLEDYWTNGLVYNNLHVNSISGHKPSNGLIVLKGRNQAGNTKVLNNTMYVVGAGGNCLYIDGATGNTMENNLVVGDGTNTFTGCLIVNTSDLSNTVDHNHYYPSGQDFFYNNHVVTFATFQSQTGFDLNSLSTNPNLDGSYVPQSGSPVIGIGVVFNSDFTTDRAGVTRGAAWDIGAYEFTGVSALKHAYSGKVSAVGNVVFA